MIKYAAEGRFLMTCHCYGDVKCYRGGFSLSFESHSAEAICSRITCRNWLDLMRREEVYLEKRIIYHLLSAPH